MSTDWPEIERGGSPYGACRDHTTCFFHGRAGAGPGLERSKSRKTYEDFSPCRTVPGSPLLFNVQPEKGTHKPVSTPRLLLDSFHSPSVCARTHVRTCGGRVMEGGGRQASPGHLMHAGAMGLLSRVNLVGYIYQMSRGARRSS